jgi:hypothetical protein
MNKRILVLKFVTDGVKLGIRLGVLLGALFGWGLTGCAVLPHGLLYLLVGLISGIIVGTIVGLFNGIILGVISVTGPSATKTFEQYRRQMSVSSFVVTLVSTVACFYILFHLTLGASLAVGIIILPAGIIAGIAAIYASRQIAQRYWSFLKLDANGGIENVKSDNALR